MNIHSLSKVLECTIEPTIPSAGSFSSAKFFSYLSAFPVSPYCLSANVLKLMALQVIPMIVDTFAVGSMGIG
jgi:hypothetical protein